MIYLQLVATYSICSVQVEFEDKVTPEYLKRPTPSTSLSNIEIDIAVAASNLRSLPISRDLVFSMLSVSFFRFSHRAVLMNNLQLLQNKAAKTILDRPFHSSAADALEALGWLTLEKRMDLLVNKDIQGYDALLKDNLRLPRVRRNWGKERTH